MSLTSIRINRHQVPFLGGIYVWIHPTKFQKWAIGENFLGFAFFDIFGHFYASKKVFWQNGGCISRIQLIMNSQGHFVFCFCLIWSWCYANISCNAFWLFVCLKIMADCFRLRNPQLVFPGAQQFPFTGDSCYACQVFLDPKMGGALVL